MNTVYQRVTPNDFVSFRAEYKNILKEKISFSTDIFFLTTVDEISANGFSDDLVAYLTDIFNSEKIHLKSCIREKYVFFFYQLEEQMVAGVAVLSDPAFVRKISQQWLDACYVDSLEMFLLVKQAGTDCETGLLHRETFAKHLKTFSINTLPKAIFAEIFPQGKSAFALQKYKAKGVRFLQLSAGKRTPLYYLGNHLYVFLFPHSTNRKRLEEFSKKILSGLKRERFKKGHIGIVDVASLQGKAGQSCNDDRIQEAAWKVLAQAKNKGPFALCDYEQIIHPEKHPLAKPSKSLQAKLSWRWREFVEFSLILLQCEEEQGRASLLSFFPDTFWLQENDQIYLLLPDVAGERAKERVEKAVRTADLRYVYCGIAEYPCKHFSKSSTIVNSRKALLHARFFQPPGLAIFDNVSCNVSGDIYYSEGNLKAAIHDYINGLLFDSEDCNLLNSLGVAYADIGRYKEGCRCFENVLRIENSNYMALYNLGLGYESTGRGHDAILCYEKVLAEKNTDFPDARRDVQYRLARLYYDAAKYDLAIDLLLPLYHATKNSVANGRIVILLGKTYHAAGMPEQACVYLQKSLQFDTYDAHSMGLLGYSYLLTSQGNDIALSLCLKSVDIEPNTIALRVYLGYALLAAGRYPEAREEVGSGLRKKDVKVDCQIIYCESYIGEKRKTLAAYWLRKCEGNTGMTAMQKQRIDSLSTELKGIKL